MDAIERVVVLRDSLKGDKNLPLLIHSETGNAVISESNLMSFTKWDDDNGILYSFRLKNLTNTQNPSNLSNEIEVIGVPYDHISTIETAHMELKHLDGVFGSMEAHGITFKEGFKDQIKYVFKEALHPNRWGLDHSELNAMHGFEALNTKDEYYRGRFAESFKETRDTAERNAWVQAKKDAGEDPTKDKVPLSNRVQAPVNHPNGDGTGGQG